MSRLKLKIEPMQNYILPNLKDGIDYLNKACNCLDSASAPSSYGFNLGGTSSELNDISNILRHEQSKVEAGIPKIIRKEYELEQMACVLSMIEITKRNPQI